MQLLAKGESFPYYCIYLYRKFGEVGIYKSLGINVIRCTPAYVHHQKSLVGFKRTRVGAGCCAIPPTSPTPYPRPHFYLASLRNRVSEGFAT